MLNALSLNLQLDQDVFAGCQISQTINRPMSEPQAPAKPSPTPSNQIDPDALISSSNPPVRRPQGGSRKAWTLALGPGSRVQARLQVRF